MNDLSKGLCDFELLMSPKAGQGTNALYTLLYKAERHVKRLSNSLL